jgi:DNA-binding SARP family transcriptional activator
LATKLRQDGEVKQKLEAKQAETSGELEAVREKLQAAINKNSQDDKVIQYLSRVYYNSQSISSAINKEYQNFLLKKSTRSIRINNSTLKSRLILQRTLTLNKSPPSAPISHNQRIP